MPVLRHDDHVTHEFGPTLFHSYVSPSRGSDQLCAWRVELPPGVPGAPHRVSHEEVLLVLDGHAISEVEGEVVTVGPGDVVVIPAGASTSLGTPADCGVTAWVATSHGLRAELADGTQLAPPWAT